MMFRLELIQKHPTLYLDRHLDQLNERELEAAARASPKTAFDSRYFLKGRRHAILLAYSYPAALMKPRCAHEPEFVLELKDSVLGHPRIWRRAHDQSFPKLFRGLESVLGIQFSGPELLRLSDSLGRKRCRELRQYIASAI